MSNELRVLVVEDSPQDVALINHELRKSRLRFRSRRVDSADAFLHELEHHPPDVILSDHGIPGFDGLAALAEARKRCPQTPFIFVTGVEREEAARQTAQSGADGYVLKSQMTLLVPTIERAVRDAPSARRESGEDDSRNRLAKLEADCQETEKFAHSIARDLQLPLHHIESCSELLIKSTRDRLDAKSLGYVKSILEASHRMAELIDRLLAFSRTSQAEMYHLSLSLKDITQEVIHELRHQTEGREIEWRLGELPEVTGDSVMLWRVMVYLISNALKFTREIPHARIEIGALDSEKEHTIFVRDNGVGFDSKSAQKLFGVFQRLHGAEFEGAGVGLANVRRIVERHGGRVRAEGMIGEGATFYFTLPK